MWLLSLSLTWFAVVQPLPGKRRTFLVVIANTLDVIVGERVCGVRRAAVVFIAVACACCRSNFFKRHHTQDKKQHNKTKRLVRRKGLHFERVQVCSVAFAKLLR